MNYIFIKGEYVKILSGSWPQLGDENKEKIIGNCGQIDKVLNIDKDQWPYMVVTLTKDGETIKFLANKDELELKTFKQAEVELEIIGYFRKVKR